ISATPAPKNAPPSPLLIDRCLLGPVPARRCAPSLPSTWIWRMSQSPQTYLSIQRSLNPVEQPRFVLRFLGGPPQGVFPNPQDPPVGPPQGARHQKITRSVAGKFIFPKGAVGFRLGRVLGAAMPETAVHEDRQLELGKNKIGTHP